MDTKNQGTAFQRLMLTYAEDYEIKDLFSDLLTVMLWDLSSNRSYAEISREGYADLILRYVDRRPYVDFHRVFTAVITDMQARRYSPDGSDVLGDFYEQYLAEEFDLPLFTPQSLCDQAALMLARGVQDEDAFRKKPQRFIDSTCGSGRALVAAGRTYGVHHHFYGVASHELHAKIATLNLFLSGMHRGEVLWADAAEPAYFKASYILRSCPFGVYRTEKREESDLARIMQGLIKSGLYPLSFDLASVPWATTMRA